MARMWPTSIPPDVLRNPLRAAEIDVYRALQSQLDDNWWVFYSRPWLGLTSTGEERDGECDFVVAHARRGILCLEVKGGAVSWNPTSGQWTSKDRYGITHHIKDPVDQARASKYEILRKVKDSPTFSRRWIAARHGVILPDCIDPGMDLGVDRPRRIFCFAADYQQNLAQWIECRFGDEEGERNEPLGIDGLHRLKDLLARPIRLEASLGRAVRSEDAELACLTQQQFHLMEAICDQPRVLIHGGAGTGKTVLAARLAHDLAERGMRTLLVCYNRPLANRLAAQLSGIERLEVHSFHQICRLVIQDAGQQVPLEDGDRRVYFDELLPAAAGACAASATVRRFDAIIVDEGQDFRDIWWLVLDALLDPNGPRIVRVFADNNQRVYRDVRQLASDLQLAPLILSYNLRNTRAIHRVAYRHYRGSAVRCEGPAGEAPEAIEVAGRSQAVEQARLVVSMLLGKHAIAPHDVALLVPDDSWGAEVIKGGKVGSAAVSNAAGQRQGHVIVDTVRRFKGLESLVAVVVVDAELAANQELAYVAMSRARTRAYLVGQARHLGPLLQGE